MSTSKSPLAPGQILFDFGDGNGPVPTLMAKAREWNISQNRTEYIERREAIRARVEAVVSAAIDQADIAFAMAHADQVASRTDLDEHARNLKRIQRDTRKAAFIAEGYGECKNATCDSLTSPRKSGIPYDFCREHSY